MRAGDQRDEYPASMGMALRMLTSFRARITHIPGLRQKPDANPAVKFPISDVRKRDPVFFRRQNGVNEPAEA